MSDNANKNKIKNLSDKSINNEVYEQMETDNLDIELIRKRKNRLNFSSAEYYGENRENPCTIFILIIIFFFSLFFAFFSFKNRMSKTTINKKFTLNYKIDYKKNKTRNYITHRDFEALSISQFPSGNFIIHDEILAIIYDNNFKELQQIYIFDIELLQAKTHFPKIIKLIIKDDNNFIICTSYGSIKFYTKINGEFIFKNEIKDLDLTNIYLTSNKDKLFALSNNTLYIFEENNDKDFIIKKNIYLSNIENENIITELFGQNNTDLMILEDKNILIVKQVNSIKFYNMTKNYELIYTFKDKYIVGMERFEDDKLLIICDFNYFKIISIYENKVYNSIKTDFELVDVKYHKDKGIILLGGAFEVSDRHMRICHSKIQIYRYDNFELIKDIKDEQYYTVDEINILSNGNVAICYGKAATFWNIVEN